MRDERNAKVNTTNAKGNTNIEKPNRPTKGQGNSNSDKARTKHRSENHNSKKPNTPTQTKDVQGSPIWEKRRDITKHQQYTTAMHTNKSQTTDHDDELHKRKETTTTTTKSRNLGILDHRHARPKRSQLQDMARTTKGKGSPGQINNRTETSTKKCGGSNYNNTTPRQSNASSSPTEQQNNDTITIPESMGGPRRINSDTNPKDGEILRNSNKKNTDQSSQNLPQPSGNGGYNYITEKQQPTTNRTTTGTNARKIATFNIKGGLMQKIKKIVDIMKEENIEHLVVTETRQQVKMNFVINKEQIQIETRGDPNHGIGVVARKPIQQISFPDTTTVHFTTQQNTKVIGVYAPNDSAKEEIKQKFYENLTTQIQREKPDIIIGDFNAGHEQGRTKNINNIRLLAAMEKTANLKRLHHPPTFRTTRGGHLRTLDRILVREPQNFDETKVRWTKISDHAILAINLKEEINLKRHKRPYYKRQQRKHTTNESHKNNRDTWKQFVEKHMGKQRQKWKIEDKPRKHAKRDFYRKNPLQMLWKTRRESKRETTYTMYDNLGNEIPREKHNKLVSEYMQDIWQQQKERKEKRDENRGKKRDKKGDETENKKRDEKENEKREDKKDKKTKGKREEKRDGKREEIKEIKAEKLGKSKVPDKEEIREAIKHLKRGKARGIDKVQAEQLKNLQEEQLEELTAIIQEAWKEEKVHENWVELRTTAIPKARKVDATQFRPISIEPMILKLLNTILMLRIRTIAEQQYHPNQFGCRTGANTQQAIQIITMAITEALNKLPQKKYVIISTDFNKAYDSIQHNKIIEEAKKLKDHTLVQLVKSQYKQLKTRVHLQREHGPYIKIKNGIIQGDPLSPLLFVMAITQIHNSIEQIKDDITAISWVDDIIAIAPLQAIERYIKTINEKATEIGLTLNLSKSKIVPLGYNLNKKKIEEISVRNSTKFLGIILDSFATFDKDTQRRKEEAISTMNNMMGCIRKTEAEIRQKMIDREKLQAMELTALTQLEYLKNAIPFTETQKKDLRQARADILRITLGLRADHQLTTEDIIGKAERIKEHKDSRKQPLPPKTKPPKPQKLKGQKKPTAKEIEDRKEYVNKHKAKKEICQGCGVKLMDYRSNEHRWRVCRVPLYGQHIKCQKCERWYVTNRFITHSCAVAEGSIVRENDLDWTRWDMQNETKPQETSETTKERTIVNKRKLFGKQNTKTIAVTDSKNKEIGQNAASYPTCEECKKSYTSLRGLKIHMKRMHNKDNKEKSDYI